MCRLKTVVSRLCVPKPTSTATVAMGWGDSVSKHLARSTRRSSTNARGVTPLERRLELLRWASRAGAFIIEDDYDSVYRFEGRPVPALQSLDQGSSVILTGSFTKLMFSSLRLGYVVLPESLVDYFLAFRYRTDLRSLTIEQAVLCDFMAAGHRLSVTRRIIGRCVHRRSNLGFELEDPLTVGTG